MGPEKFDVGKQSNVFLRRGREHREDDNLNRFNCKEHILFFTFIKKN